MMIDRNPALWDIDLSPFCDVPVVIETDEGGRRDTVIKKIECKTIAIGDLDCPLPRRLVLDDDNDWISIEVVRSIRKK